MKDKKAALSGNEAGALAMKHINPDVVAAYPITPQTELMQNFAQFYADGEVDSEMILVESEHSAMSACVGASAGGARVMTATSANGLALMWEIVYIAASTRLPIVMNVVNRALSGPINIHCDHSDSMGARDSGWLQVYSENAQEVYDNTIMAMKIAEHKDVRLPMMVCQDGFITSHATDVVIPLEDPVVKKFIGEHVAVKPLLDTDNPVTYGPLDLQDYYFEHKRQQIEGITNAKKVFLDVCKEFKKISGRDYGYFEEYKMEDAEQVLVVMSSTAGTAKLAVDELREEGKKVGLLKIRLFRPFPYEEVAKLLSKAKSVAVLDRSASFGAEPPLFSAIRSAMYNDNTALKSYIFGLGGRDIFVEDIKKTLTEVEGLKETSHEASYIGVR